MPRTFHVVRNPSGDIVSVALHPQAGSEALHESHPDLAGFLGIAGSNPGFSSSDAEFVRVLEDLIDMLILKNIIHHTDLPEAAQKKLVARKGLRNRMLGALNPLVDDTGLI